MSNAIQHSCISCQLPANMSLLRDSYGGMRSMSTHERRIFLSLLVEVLLEPGCFEGNAVLEMKTPRDHG